MLLLMAIKKYIRTMAVYVRPILISLKDIDKFKSIQTKINFSV